MSVNTTQDTPQEILQKLPFKEPEEKTWSTICVDLIGPYDVTTKDDIEIILNAMTIDDPAIGWFSKSLRFLQKNWLYDS